MMEEPESLTSIYNLKESENLIILRNPQTGWPNESGAPAPL
jgi:hypothetical protein